MRERGARGGKDKDKWLGYSRNYADRRKRNSVDEGSEKMEQENPLFPSATAASTETETKL